MVVAFITCVIASLALTPLVKKFAIAIGAVDKPNYRKVHQRIMPRMGGLAIFISFLIGMLVLRPDAPYGLPLMNPAIIIGSFIIILTGVFDDRFELSAKVKLAGQIAAALVVVVYGDVRLDFFNLPFGGTIEFNSFLSIPLTIIWIVAITNAINLIDGLDGLAAGVSTIALFTISFMAFLKGDIYVMSVALIVAASTIGFLKYNFHPAKIFMGDTGALFLGYIISVVSLLGFKNVTVVSLIIPIIVLGVPISDTIFAIIRRKLNKQPISAPDKSHLHHCLLRTGYTHKQTVLIIYMIAMMFGLAAVIFSMATLWGAIIMMAVITIAIEIFVESIGLIGNDYKPLLNFVKGGTKKNM